MYKIVQVFKQTKKLGASATLQIHVHIDIYVKICRSNIYIQKHIRYNVQISYLCDSEFKMDIALGKKLFFSLFLFQIFYLVFCYNQGFICITFLPSQGFLIFWGSYILKKPMIYEICKQERKLFGCKFLLKILQTFLRQTCTVSHFSLLFST